MMNDLGFVINNIDINIVLQKPHINSYISSIRKNLSKIINMHVDKISIKATTADHLGFIGKGEGIMSTATLLLMKNS